MPSTSIDGFSVLSPSQRKELERQRQEEEARKAAKKAEETRKSQEASRRAKEAAEQRKAAEARKKAEAEEKEQRRKALKVFLCILLVALAIAWVYVSFNYFNWVSESDDSTIGQIIEGCINMLWTGILVVPFGAFILVKLLNE